MFVDNNLFNSPTKGQIDRGTVIQEIALFVATAPDHKHNIVIGTDSQVKRNELGQFVDYVSAVIIHRPGHGGRYFWQKQRHYLRKITLRDRIYQEVSYSLDLASKIVPTLRVTLEEDKYALEIHIDVGTHGPTKDLIKEVVGMVNGNGYTAQIKPLSYGASCIADHHT